MFRLAILLVGLFPITMAADTVLFHDKFQHEPGPLAGKVPTVSHDGSPWISAYRGKKPSFFGPGRLSANRQSAIWVPFEPRSGNRYVLQAWVLMEDGPTNRGISLGFAAEELDKEFSKLVSYGTMVMYRNPKKTLEVYAGPGKQAQVTAPNIALRQTELKIILDASESDSANWSLSFFADGMPIGENVRPADGANLGEIRFAGFTVVGGGGGLGYFNDFMLKEVPVE